VEGRAGNQAPVAVDDSASTVVDTPISIAVLANDSDPDGDLLTIVGVTTPANGTAVISGTLVVYTPALGYTGNDAFEYTISDGLGGTDTATVAVEVRAGNQPPVAMSDTANTTVGITVTISVLANDSDPNGDALTIIDVSAPAHGLATISGDVILYYPGGYVGSDTFTYMVSDGFGGTDVADVTVEVTSDNQAPAAVDDIASTLVDTQVTIAVLANDSDPDGDTLNLAGVSTPVHGMAEVNGNNVTYTPAAGYTGTDTFTYTVSDGIGGTATATVTVTVTEIVYQTYIFLPVVLR
jgi:hypothetical protein